MLRGVFQRFPTDFQQEPLLRIHALCLARRYPKKFWVEVLYSVDKPAPASGHLARRIGVRVVPLVNVPAVTRHFGNGVRTVLKQSPERFKIIGSARNTASGADDGDDIMFPVLWNSPLREFDRRRFELCVKHLAFEIRSHRLNIWKIKNQRGRQLTFKTQLPIEHIPELDGHERVESKIHESLRQRKCLWRINSHHCGKAFTDEVLN